MDVTGSNTLTTAEFASGTSRLGVRWQDITGLAKSRDFFRLFDANRDGVIEFYELFPDEMPRKHKERASTPEFWNEWCTRNDDCTDPTQQRGPKWQPCTPHESLNILTGKCAVLEDVQEKRRWMSASFRRLKTQGRSDAKCREIVALHLPRGTGPRDRDEVATFSKADSNMCRRAYTDKLQEPVRRIQKGIYDMREQTRLIKIQKHQLYLHTVEPLRRLHEQEEADKKKAEMVMSLAGGVSHASMLGRVKDSNLAGDDEPSEHNEREKGSSPELTTTSPPQGDDRPQSSTSLHRSDAHAD